MSRKRFRALLRVGMHLSQSLAGNPILKGMDFRSTFFPFQFDQLASNEPDSQFAGPGGVPYGSAGHSNKFHFLPRKENQAESDRAIVKGMKKDTGKQSSRRLS